MQWLNASAANMQVYRTMRSVYDTLLCGEADLHLAPVSPAQSRSNTLSASSSRYVRRFVGSSVAAVAACAAVFCGVYFGTAHTGSLLSSSNQIDCITTPVGQRTELKLADGTRVWLSSNSTLRLPSDGSQRSVNLSGEAFFAVAKDPGHPFVVNLNGRSVTVYGTRFNVSAYPGHDVMDVQLYDGSVSVTDSASVRTFLLHPGEQFVADASGMSVTTFDRGGNSPLWIQGIHTFRNKSIPEILTAMSHVYNFNLRIDSRQLSSQRVTCKFHEADGMDNMIQSLNDIHPFTYHWNPDTRTLQVK